MLAACGSPFESVPDAPPSELGLAAIVDFRSTLGSGEQFEAAVLTKHVDERGTTHVLAEVSYLGRPMFGSALRAHVDADGTVQPLRSPRAVLEPGTVPATVLGEDAARSRAVAAVPSAAEAIDIDQIWFPADLKAFASRGAVSVASVLAYRVHLRGTDPTAPEPFTVFIGAEDGAVLYVASARRAAAGFGNTHYYAPQVMPLDITNTSGTKIRSYALRDVFGNNTLGCDYASSIHGVPSCSDFADSDGMFGNTQLYETTTFEPFSVTGQTPAAEAHFAVTSTFRMLVNVFGQAVPPGVTTSVDILTNNAYYMGGGQIWIGYCTDQDDTNLPYSALDVVGHETGHYIFSTYVGGDDNVGYSFGEGGGLGEAMGDIIGEMASRYGRAIMHGSVPSQIPTTPDWASGDEMGSCPWVRRMDNPAAGSGYNARTWTDDSEIDPHDAAGPIDRMFYFLSEGVAPLTTAQLWSESTYLPAGLQGIGITKAGIIWLSAIRDYYTPFGNFDDVRDAALDAAYFSYGANSVEHKAVADAFAAVNIGSPAQRTRPNCALTAQDLPSSNDVQVEVTCTVSGSPAPFRLELTMDAAPIIQPTTLKSVTRNVTMTDDGFHMFRIRATDAELNVLDRSVPYFWDKLGPDFGAFSNAGTMIDPLYHVPVTDPSNIAQVALRIDGASTPAYVDSASPFDLGFDARSLSDGDHALLFTATDGLGNTRSLPKTLRIDYTAPVIGPVTVTGTGPFTLAVTPTDMYTVASVTMKVEGLPLTVTRTTNTFSASYAPPVAGPRTLVVTSTDWVGNISLITRPAPQDVTPPDPTGVYISEPASTTTVTWNAVMTVATNADAKRVEFHLDQTAGISGSEPLLCTDTTAPFQCTVNKSAYAEGRYYMWIKVFDQVGNFDIDEDETYVDKTPPVIDEVYGSVTSLPNGHKQVTIGIRAHDNLAMRMIELSSDLCGGGQSVTGTSNYWECTVEHDTWHAHNVSYTGSVQDVAKFRTTSSGQIYLSEPAPPPPPPPPPASPSCSESEPNDTGSTADLPDSTCTSVAGTISISSPDYFRFTIAPSHSLRFNDVDPDGVWSSCGQYNFADASGNTLADEYWDGLIGLRIDNTSSSQRTVYIRYRLANTTYCQQFNGFPYKFQLDRL